MTQATGVFKPNEIEALEEVLDDYHAVNREAYGHHCTTLWVEDRRRGFVYFAPASMTDRSWYLYWIAIEPADQGRGWGSRLLQHAEMEARAADARMLLIETSSLPTYEPTRRFYLKHGYTQVATLPDFYADGDSMVVFAKRLSPAPASP